MLLYPLHDLDMYLSLPFLTQLCDGKFSDLHSNDESPLQSRQMIQEKSTKIYKRNTYDNMLNLTSLLGLARKCHGYDLCPLL